MANQKAWEVKESRAAAIVTVGNEGGKCEGSEIGGFRELLRCRQPSQHKVNWLDTFLVNVTVNGKESPCSSDW